MGDVDDRERSYPPFAKPAPLSRGSTLLIVGIAAIATVMAIASTVWLSQGTFIFQCGRANSDPPFILAEGEGILLIIWMASITVLVCGSFWRMRRLGQRAFRATLFLCVASTPVACAYRKLPPESYIAGFSEWAIRNVNINAIQNWQASLPPATTKTTVPPSRWPEEVSSLIPATVEQMPNEQGISLQWGRLATWGTSRKVFVAPDTNTAPPADDLHPWVQVAPTLYVALQIGG